MEALLKNKVAIITGAGTGLGAETARTLAAQSAALVLNGRRPDKLAEVAADIREAGGEVVEYPADASDPTEIERLVEAAVDAYGGVDILVNNAAIHAHFTRLANVSVAEFDEYLSVNLRGPFLMCRSAIPRMVERGGGAVVNMSSVAGFTALKHASSYSTAKSGLFGLTRALALEFGPDGVTVNCLCPGGMTPHDPSRNIASLGGTAASERTAEELELRSTALVSGVPLGRPATTTEVANLILYLVGPYGGATTGAVIPIDGGYTAQ